MAFSFTTGYSRFYFLDIQHFVLLIELNFDYKIKPYSYRNHKLKCIDLRMIFISTSFN